MAYLLQNRAERRRAHRRKNLALPWFFLSKKKKTPPTNDALGRPSTIFYPDNTREDREYDAEGRLEKRTNRRGISDLFSYNEIGNMTSTTYAFGTTDSASDGREYDIQGRLVLETDANGNKVKHEYDQAGRRTKTIRGYQGIGSTPVTLVFQYDANGNQTDVTDANGTTHTDYDLLNRPTTVTFADGSKNITVYDKVGRKKVVITGQKGADPGKRMEYDWDKLGNLTDVREYEGGAVYNTHYTYDEAGNLKSARDARGNTVWMDYDAMGRRVKRTLPNGKYEQWAYDKTGGVTLYTDFNLVNTAYTIDGDTDRVTAETRPDGATGYTYLATGVRSTKTDSTGTVTYHYTARDMMKEEIRPDVTLTYTHDGVGNVTRVTSTIGNVNEVRFDALGRPATVTDSFLGDTVSGYDGAGNLEHYTYPNQVKTSFGYTNANRMNNVTVANLTTSTTLANFGYALNGAGMKTQVVESISGRQVDWTYDGLFRLISETTQNDPNRLNGGVTYTWDEVGNRTSRTSTLPPAAGVTNQAFANLYDNTDRFINHTFDDNGSTLGADGRTYTYDSRRRLTRVQGTGLDVQYQYDSDGNLVQRADANAGTTTKYVFDNQNATGYSQTLEEIVNNTPKVRYTYGTRLISRAEWNGSQWSRRFYQFDGEGNVAFLTDETGTITDRYTYADGRVIRHDGTSTNEFLMKGERVDPATGLVFLRARWMDPNYERFETRDDFEGATENPLTRNAYLFGNGDQINNADPSGNFTYVDVSIASSIAGMIRSQQISAAINIFDKNPEAQENDLYLTALVAGVPIIGGSLKALTNIAFKVLRRSGGAIRASGWLLKLEALGGHTITKHVAQSSGSLLRRLQAERYIPAATSFETIRDAEKWTGRVLELNRGAIKNATQSLKGKETLAITEYFGEAVGGGYRRGSQMFENAENVTVVLGKNKFDQLIVLSAFPSF